MTAVQPTPTPSIPPTRDPITHGRALGEGAFLTALATVILWLISLLPVPMPENVQLAMVGIIVTLGNVALSEWRNQRHQVQLLSRSASMSIAPRLLAFAILTPFCLIVGCINFAGTDYKSVASAEIVALSAAADATPLDAARCRAHRQAAADLRNGDGDSSSVNLPFFAGQHIAALASSHDRMGAICEEMVRRDASRGVTPNHRQQLRADWLRAWRDGRTLLGGPE